MPMTRPRGDERPAGEAVVHGEVESKHAVEPSARGAAPPFDVGADDPEARGHVAPWPPTASTNDPTRRGARVRARSR
jgi:hypothetical protein